MSPEQAREVRDTYEELDRLGYLEDRLEWQAEDYLRAYPHFTMEMVEWLDWFVKIDLSPLQRRWLAKLRKNDNPLS